MRRKAERPVPSMTGWPGKVRCRSFSICKFQSLLEGCHPAPTLLLSSLEAPSADQHASTVMSGTVQQALACFQAQECTPHLAT
ncbi:MAG: hypothetical protein FRX49_09738 [Trebouxia sp. A1-2]|nr:MAG: hypothetical protein FRX49_09738 [Trebouxia sp. A1-2]